MSKTTNENKLMMVPLDVKKLASLFTKRAKHCFTVEQGLPKDAIIKSAQISSDGKQILLIVWSSEFKLVPAGRPLQTLEIIVKRNR